jgi:hypothetical protein
MNPVTVLDIMDGKTNQFNPNGLFSIPIFGKVGDEARNRVFSYIDLHTTLLHPMIYRVLTELKSLYKGIASSKEYALWNDEIKDFEKSNALKGKTGYAYLMAHLKDVKFEREGSELIQQKVKVVEENIKSGKAFISQVIVMPAGLRDYEIDKTGKPTENEVNIYYRKLLAASHLITKADPNSIALNMTRFRMQIDFLELYEYIENLLKGKRKLILGKWASRQIFNGTRNVITSMINNTAELHAPNVINMNSTAIGLFQFLKASLPVSIYNIRNGYLLNVMPGPNSPFFMTNKKTLKKEMVPHNTLIYDQWMTDEGLEKTITRYSEIPLRHMVLDTDNHYLCLIYKDSDKYMLLQDIDDLPEGLNKKLVYPITFTEILYLSVYKIANKLPAFVTRYPVLGTGGIYPSKVYLKTTINSSIKKELDQNGIPTGSVAYEFPILNDKFMNTIAPSINHIKRLGADYDGDTSSFTIAYSEQAIAEVDKYLETKRFYLGSDGKMVYSMATDTINFVVSNMTAA